MFVIYLSAIIIWKPNAITSVFIYDFLLSLLEKASKIFNILFFSVGPNIYDCFKLK